MAHSSPGACRLQRLPLVCPATAHLLHPAPTPRHGNRSHKLRYSYTCFFFVVNARALFLLEEGTAAEVVETIVFEALFFNVSPSTDFGLFLPEMTFDISGTNSDNWFCPNLLATGITYCSTRSIGAWLKRIANSPNLVNHTDAQARKKRLHREFESFFAGFCWQSQHPSICLARFISLSSFPGTTVKKMVFCD